MLQPIGDSKNIYNLTKEDLVIYMDGGMKVAIPSSKEYEARAFLEEMISSPISGFTRKDYILGGVKLPEYNNDLGAVIVSKEAFIALRGKREYDVYKGVLFYPEIKDGVLVEFHGGY